jgi:hypothetical protein
MTLVAEGEAHARTGHDMLYLSYFDIARHAPALEPADDIVEELQRTYGELSAAAEHWGKSDGQWVGVPTSFLSGSYSCVGRIDILKQHANIDLQAIFPAQPEMGPSFDGWTWEAFLSAAEACAKTDAAFGLPISPCADAWAWLGMVFRSFGAELVDGKGQIAVKSDATVAALDYLRRLGAFLPTNVYTWDNASNNRALISGRSALIVNPASAWAQAVKDQPQIGSQCWHFPAPAGPKGRYITLFPAFLCTWSFSPNKAAAKELIRWLSRRETVERICIASHGYNIPPFLSMSDFKVWQEEGLPVGTLYNYPIKPSHHTTTMVPTDPAPTGIAPPIYNLWILPNMVAKVTQSKEPIESAIAWAERELEGTMR